MQENTRAVPVELEVPAVVGATVVELERIAFEDRPGVPGENGKARRLRCGVVGRTCCCSSRSQSRGRLRRGERGAGVGEDKDGQVDREAEDDNGVEDSGVEAIGVDGSTEL